MATPQELLRGGPKNVSPTKSKHKISRRQNQNSVAFSPYFTIIFCIGNPSPAISARGRKGRKNRPAMFATDARNRTIDIGCGHFLTRETLILTQLS
jgi:hypothetical protein